MSELGTMIRLSKLIEDYDENDTELIERQNRLLVRQKVYVYLTIVVSVFLLGMITWINFAEGRGDE